MNLFTCYYMLYDPKFKTRGGVERYKTLQSLLTLGLLSTNNPGKLILWV